MRSKTTRRGCVERPIDGVASVPDATDEMALRAFLEERLLCPLEVQGANSAGVQARLTKQWWTVAEAFAVDLEASLPIGEEIDLEYAFHMHFEVLGTDMRSDAINIQTWYSLARQEFLESVRLFRCEVVDSSERSKHYPLSNKQTPDDLRRASKSGHQSYWSPKVSQHDVGAFARELEECFFDRLLSESSMRLFLAHSDVVGYSDGEDTTFLAMEWASSGALHGYPVSESDVDLTICSRSISD